MKRKYNILQIFILAYNILILLWSVTFMVSYAAHALIGCVAYAIIFTGSLLSLNYILWRMTKSAKND